MARPLESFAADLPAGSFWLTGRWMKDFIAALVADRARLAPASGRETPTGKGRIFTVEGGGGSSLVRHPWQPYSVGGLNLRIRPGAVWDGSRTWLPANRNVQITVPPNCADGYFVWLAGQVDEQGLLTSLSYGHGTTLPPAVALTDDSSPPPLVYDLLFYVTSTADALDDLSHVFRSSPLALRPIIVGGDYVTGLQRRMYFSPNPSVELP